LQECFFCVVGGIMALWMGFHFMFWGETPLKWRIVAWFLLVSGVLTLVPEWRFDLARLSTLLYSIAVLVLSLAVEMVVVWVVGVIRCAQLEAQEFRRRRNAVV
jgi:hypothetical protein